MPPQHYLSIAEARQTTFNNCVQMFKTCFRGSSLGYHAAVAFRDRSCFRQPCCCAKWQPPSPDRRPGEPHPRSSHEQHRVGSVNKEALILTEMRMYYFRFEESMNSMCHNVRTDIFSSDIFPPPPNLRFRDNLPNELIANHSLVDKTVGNRNDYIADSLS